MTVAAWRLIRQWLAAKQFVWLVLALALILRILCVHTFAVKPVSDFQWYYDRGVELTAGRGLIFAGQPTAYWPVGYPAFLMVLFSLFKPSVLVAQYGNVALSIATLLLAYRITFGLTGSWLAARIVLFILAIFPNQVAYTGLLASEPLANFVLLL